MNKLFIIIFSLSLSILISACASMGDKPLTAEGLFERHVEVAYGGKGQSAQTSVTTTGNLIIEDFGIEAPVTTKAMAPGYLVFEANLMGMEISQGCNTDGCWGQDQSGNPITIADEQLESLRQQADMRQWENIAQYYETLEIVPNDDPEATEYKVKAVNKRGRENYYYFSKETGLLNGFDITADSPMGVSTTNSIMKNYQDYGGILWPQTMEQVTPMVTIKIVVDDVSYKPLTESSFVSAD